VFCHLAVSGGQSTKNFHKTRRRIQICYGERFYDLVRWGDAAAVLGGRGYQPKHQYYQFPQQPMINLAEYLFKIKLLVTI
jgi:hypothetical protein